jgi:polar amino acid transport system substrate-binding protein
MKLNVVKIIICAVMISICLSGISSAKNTLIISLGTTLPPHVIQKNNEGISLDIIRKCLGREDYELEFKYFPYARRILEFKEGRADAVYNIVREDIENHGLVGFLSDPAFIYENVAVSLKKNKYQISNISDLKDYSVISWQGASNLLGEEYAKMAESNKNYREIANQERQIALLFMGRAEVIQLDLSIFHYYRNLVRKEGKYKVDVEQPVDIFPLFGKIAYSMFFRDKATTVAFNKRLQEIRESGEYKEIVDKYTQF